ncbi:MAG: hypothetical protein IIB88_00705 [Chloroflexi bacterium]|nr:hypothetical protein [Chloroflexota bacterium]
MTLQSFVGVLFEPDDIVEYRLIDPNGDQSIKQQWHAARRFARAVAWLTAQNAAGYGCYLGALPRTKASGAKAKAVALARVVFVDIDNVDLNEAQHKLRESGLPAPTLTVVSGGGVHFWWKLSQPMTELDRWSRIMRGMIAAIESALSCHGGSST